MLDNIIIFVEKQRSEIAREQGTYELRYNYEDEKKYYDYIIIYYYYTK